MRIFIADVTDDFRLSRKRLIKKLEEKNATVHYQLPPPFKMDLHDSIFNTTMSDCDVSVHILSQYPGRTFEDTDKVYIALHQANAGFVKNNRKVFWIPKNLELEAVDESDYRDFLSTLEFGYDDHSFTLLKGDPQTLHDDIVNAITFPQEAVSPNGILIVHHSKDEDAAIRVRERARQKNIQTQYNTSCDENPATNLKLLTDQLKDVNGAIMVMGGVNHEWVKERAKHILSTLIQLEHRLDWLGFYFSQGSQAFTFDGRFLRVKVLDESKQMQDQAAWNNFFQE